MRDPGDIYWYDFPDPIGRHPTVIVSRETNRNSVIVALVTSKPQGPDVDILAIAGLDCERLITGWLRGDLIANIPRDDPYWGRYIGRMSEQDLLKARRCVCAAVGQ